VVFVGGKEAVVAIIVGFRGVQHFVLGAHRAMEIAGLYKTSGNRAATHFPTAMFAIGRSAAQIWTVWELKNGYVDNELGAKSSRLEKALECEFAHFAVKKMCAGVQPWAVLAKS
jgi:hypothetical protein